MTTPVRVTALPPVPNAPVLVLQATAWAVACPASFIEEEARSRLIRPGANKHQGR